MTNERLVELIQLDIDAMATSEERAELEAELAASPEARTIQEGLRMVARRLEEAPAVEPRAALKGEVLAELRRRASLAPIVSPAAWSARRRVLSYAWLAAAAVVIGLALSPFFVQLRKEVVPSHAGATMARVDPGSWPVVQRAGAPIGGSSATLVIRRNGDRYAVEPFGVGAKALSLQWDPAAFELDFSTRKGNDSQNTIQVSGTFPFSGEENPTVVLRRIAGGSRPTEVVLRSEERELLRASIPVD